MKAKKSLGQHFLKSEEALTQIVEAAKATVSEVVLEIGPGMGALTKALLHDFKKVVAVETDRRMVDLLKKIFKKEIESGKLTIIEKDILEFSPEVLKDFGNSYQIVANIPYYITGEILRKFLGNIFQPKGVTLLVQKEVAERVVARDGKQSILSMAVAVFGEARCAGVVKAENFEPAPRVDSAILVIENINNNFFEDMERQKFFDVLKKGFSHKRKVLLNNFDKEERKKIEKYLESKNLSLKVRAEELNREDWKQLVNLT
jgi:16S rRNA (adenine1518-N6/adenine1519-N6)-dimethyltransferase